MNEQQTIDVLNKLSGTSFKLCRNQFSDFDAQDDNYIVEIKNRRKYYKEKLIEAVKLYKNYQNAQLLNKKFLYVVTDDKGFYVYNISNHINLIIHLPIKAIMCPVSTDFDKNHKITKLSYVLPEDLAIKL